MSNSEFIFKGTSRNLKDSVIGRFLDELSEHLRQDEYPWLKNACDEWQEDWKKMPPGCKDIDLDTVITDSDKKRAFKTKVLEVQALISEESIKLELDRVLELIDTEY
jgi:hypothetical protein